MVVHQEGQLPCGHSCLGGEDALYDGCFERSVAEIKGREAEATLSCASRSSDDQV